MADKQEELQFERFKQDFVLLLARYGLDRSDRESSVPPPRAGKVFLSHVHDMWRVGDIDPATLEGMAPGDGWVDYCRTIREANLEADRREPPAYDRCSGELTGERDEWGDDDADSD